MHVAVYERRADVGKDDAPSPPEPTEPQPNADEYV
jgi:hypothetical protein